MAIHAGTLQYYSTFVYVLNFPLSFFFFEGIVQNVSFLMISRLETDELYYDIGFNYFALDPVKSQEKLIFSMFKRKSISHAWTRMLAPVWW